MYKLPKSEYMAESRRLGGQRVQTGVSVGAMARELGLVEQELRNWVKDAEKGKPNQPGAKVVSPEQMKLSCLRVENASLKMECEILKKSEGVLPERCAVKYVWIVAERDAYPLPSLCTKLSVRLSGYRAWKRGGTPNRQRQTDAQLLLLIQSNLAEVKGTYGSPRMVREIRERGNPAGKDRVELLS